MIRSIPPVLLKPVLAASLGLALLASACAVLFALLWTSEAAEERIAQTLQARAQGYALVNDVRRLETTVRRAVASGEIRLAGRNVEARLATLQERLERFFSEHEGLTNSVPLNTTQLSTLVTTIETESKAVLRGELNADRRARRFERLADLIDELIGAVATLRDNDVATLAILRERAETVRPFAIAAVLSGLIGGALAFVFAGRAVSSVVRLISRREAQLAALNHDMEGQIERRTLDLQRANEETQRFAYIVSHDLRSPLVNIVGFAHEIEADLKSLGPMIARLHARAPDLIEPAEQQAISRDVPESLGFILSSAEKMDRLINAILQHSREGRRHLIAERLDITNLVTDIAASFASVCEERSVRIDVSPLPRLIGDALAIEQIFSNLIENAIKYGKPGEANVVRVEGHEDGKRVVFSVSDQGRGIDHSDHERVFELFRRVGSQDQPGEGLGLSAVRHMVRRMEGDITFSSEPGHGTTFTFDVPKVLSQDLSIEDDGGKNVPRQTAGRERPR